MFVQKCMKGIHGITLAQAEAIVKGCGLTCAWWREVGHIRPADIDERLTTNELDLHRHAFYEQHPTRRGTVNKESPFISLTAGQVDRKAFEARNQTFHAHQVAMWFATDFGRLRGDCFIFYCWVLVAMRHSVQVRHLAEEVRELNTYTQFSPYHFEGEIVAKIEVPARQIMGFDHYEYREDRHGRLQPKRLNSYPNPGYVDYQDVTNYRDWL
jgi:hypothetical protein